MQHGGLLQGGAAGAKVVAVRAAVAGGSEIAVGVQSRVLLLEMDDYLSFKYILTNPTPSEATAGTAFGFERGALNLRR